MKVKLTNKHTRPVMLQGGMLPPGETWEGHMTQNVLDSIMFHAGDHLELKKTVTRKKARKKVKNDGGI